METKNFVYEAPQMEIMEVEIEQAVLKGSTDFDTENLPW